MSIRQPRTLARIGVVVALFSIFAVIPAKAFAIDIPQVNLPTPAKCFVDAAPQRPGDPNSHMGLYLSVACDDKYKKALGLDVASGKCYLVAFQGEHMTGEVQAGVEVDCVKTILTSTKQLVDFTKAGGNAAEQMAFWTTTGGTAVNLAATNSGSSSTSGGNTSTPTTPAAPSGSGATAEQFKYPAGTDNAYKVAASDGKYHCGDGTKGEEVKLSINLGCAGKGPAILDLMFAIIRLLSIGVGIVIVASMIVAGIQYSAARGNPQEVQKAQERIRSNVIAFGIFIFSYAILNWLVPAGLLK